MSDSQIPETPYLQSQVHAPLQTKKATSAHDEQKVVAITHWTDWLFSFTLTRPASFRFRSGEFVMLGLRDEQGKPILRAYSIASPSWAEQLEFFSIKVPDGPLTSRLQHIQIGDSVIMRSKATGTLVLDALRPGKQLYMIATGTGIAPFASIIRDPEAYEKFDRLILSHTCRRVADLAYGEDIVRQTMDDPLIGAEARQKLIYNPATTREASPYKGRITDRIRAGSFFQDIGQEPLDPACDRVMICGSIDLNREMKAILQQAGLDEGANSRPNEYVVERAFTG